MAKITMEHHDDIVRVLSKEVWLTDMQARLYVLIATRGAMDVVHIAGELETSEDEAESAASRLMELGGLIDYGVGMFESMHPRFSAVNMYRKACEERGMVPSRNNAIDNVGAALERDYDRARAKYDREGGRA